jgi:hypothetical protein
MRVKAETGGFTAYSVGSNRRDDGGDLTMAWLPVGGREAPDTGISVRYKR